MQTLVTGATGKVGHAIASALLERGDSVRALVRDAAVAREVLPPGADPVQGDVNDPSSLPAAVEDCELVFNAMGIPEQWRADAADFDRVNAQGSAAVARAAREAGARRLVHTSTIDVFHAERGARFDESEIADYPKGTPYERSKQRAEELVLAQRAAGFEVVLVNPSGVYGPGPSASVSFDDGMFEPLVRKRLPALPPGGLGLVFSPGAAQGHLLAAEKGVDGERYILCDTYATIRELATQTVAIAGRGRVPFSMPRRLAKGVAAGSEALSRIIRRPPLVSHGQIYFFDWQAHPVSAKAQRDLGWEPTPLEEGLRETLASLDLL